MSGGGSGRRLRQVDVARLAGVSQATVSLVLNGRAGSEVAIASETRQRVLDAVDQLGYSPNLAARNLAGGQNRLLAIHTFESVFPVDHHDFYYPFLIGIEEAAEDAGYDLLLATSASTSTRARSIYRDGANRLGIADGAVLLGRGEDPDELRRLVDDGFPFVYVGRRSEPDGRPIAYVTADYRAATAALADDLRSQGHRELALVRPTTGEASDDRELGYRDGAAGSEDRVVRVDLDDVDERLVDDLLGTDVTGVLVEDVAVASFVRRQVEARGLAVPQDISVVVLGVGAGDWSGFEIPRTEMGRSAVGALLKLLDDPEATPPQVVLPCPPRAGHTLAPPGRAA